MAVRVMMEQMVTCALVRVATMAQTAKQASTGHCNKCVNHHHCYDLKSKSNYNNYVLDIYYFDSNPYQHGGSCNCGIDGYVSTCPSGYNGINCETSGYLKNVINMSQSLIMRWSKIKFNEYFNLYVSEIDHSDSNPSQNGGLCNN